MFNINLNKIILLFIILCLNIDITCSASIFNHKQKNLDKQIKSTNTVQLQKNKEKKYVTKLDFEEIMAKAQEHSYDLKIADFNILIAKQGIVGARSEYFPKLIAMAGTEYTKNYRDLKDSTVMSIGESFINPYTRFQSILGITLSYNLFDFGVRKGNLDMAKEDVFIKELEVEQKRQELCLTVIDTYSKILMMQRQIQLYREISKLEKTNLGYKQRLFDAKEISKTELNDEKVKVEETNKKIYELQQMMAESLNWLEFYTGESYNIDNIKVAEMKKPDFDTMASNDYTQSVTWKIYDKQLKKKELELKVAKRTNYPKVNAYTRYYLYGSDHSSYNDSLGDIRPSNFTVGATANWMLFDGLKNRANIQKILLEYKQLQVERDKSIAELTTRLATMRSNLLYLDKQIDSNNKIIDELSDKEVSIKRLASKKLVTPIEENEAKVKLLEQHIELEKNRITSVAILRGIQILTTN